jgi:hypothetical protein
MLREPVHRVYAPLPNRLKNPIQSDRIGSDRTDYNIAAVLCALCAVRCVLCAVCCVLWTMYTSHNFT